jgi:hypothetical protein
MIVLRSTLTDACSQRRSRQQRDRWHKYQNVHRFSLRGGDD